MPASQNELWVRHGYHKMTSYVNCGFEYTQKIVEHAYSSNLKKKKITNSAVRISDGSLVVR